jgi:invasion protein IalB
MRSSVPTILSALVITLTVAFPVLAQDAGTQTNDDTSPTAEASPETGDQTSASAGDPAAAEDPVEVRATYSDWDVRCARGTDNCFMYQLASDEQNNPVAEFSIIRIENETEAKAGVTVLTPLGTLLTNGLVIQIDDGEARRFPFSWCDQAGCFGRLALNQQSINAMKAGALGKITVFSIVAPDQPITLELSLAGFTVAYESLKPTSD